MVAPGSVKADSTRSGRATELVPGSGTCAFCRSNHGRQFASAGFRPLSELGRMVDQRALVIAPKPQPMLVRPAQSGSRPPGYAPSAKHPQGGDRHCGSHEERGRNRLPVKAPSRDERVKIRWTECGVRHKPRLLSSPGALAGAPSGAPCVTTHIDPGSRPRAEPHGANLGWSAGQTEGTVFPHRRDLGIVFHTAFACTLRRIGEAVEVICRLITNS